MNSSKRLKRPDSSGLRWSLGKDDALILRREGASEEVLARGRVFSAGPAELTASVEQAQRDQNPSLRTVTLGGKWSFDAANRLVFAVSRKDRKKDALVFRGSWRTGRGNEIIYRRVGSLDGFTLSGQWRLENRGLAYVLETGDVLRVRGEFGTGSIRAKAGEFRYRLGAEARRGRRLRELVLFGSWKIGRDLGVEFEAECERGRKPVFRFGAVYEWAAGRVRASLVAPDGKRLGVEVSFERPLRGANGAAFVRLRHSAEEALAETGLSFRW